MSKVISCSLIIKDDFNNVLIIQRKVKKGQSKVWSLLNRDIKGKETTEKCLEKIAKDDLKGIVFNFTPFKDFAINENEINTSYTGIIKESIILHKDIIGSKWINKRVLDEYDFVKDNKEILLEFFESVK
ncbi:hypothetical protein [Clostridium gasigenes]|uniref:NUDIX domain-containing protein n=1 Tax=Clostridium gasigenes TaxID=94869 RepID=A0A7X0VST9_9CLOT|nr:hypothetical protein [Clostridium gasigenes]MBB6716040.1 hypothetical protein [Clostridium gasigenes]MBU3106745.1 hypothetical protein [Clostridium gasigenes]